VDNIIHLNSVHDHDETEDCDEYITDKASPENYQWHHHGPHDFGKDVTEGYYPCKPTYTRPPLRLDWQKIAPPALLKAGPLNWETTTQHIMEGRSGMFKPDAISCWTRWVIGETYGDIDNGIDDVCMVTSSQMDKENQTVYDAELWYKAQPLKERLKRLRPEHRLYRQVHRYVRRRAPWPLAQIGKQPHNLKQKELVRKFCKQSHNKYPQFTPDSALQEYKAWWNGQRHKRDLNQQVLGDLYLQRAIKLKAALEDLEIAGSTAAYLKQKCRDNTQRNWPHDLLEYSPVSQLELDTFQDWLILREDLITGNIV
jgi:hypothetical protein